MRRIVHYRTSGDCRLIDLELEPSREWWEPSREWWADGDPFVHDTSETIAAPRDPSNTGRVFQPGSTLTAMPVAHVVPEQTTRLSGETLVDDRRSWQSDDSTVRGQSANLKSGFARNLTKAAFRVASLGQNWGGLE